MQRSDSADDPDEPQRSRPSSRRSSVSLPRKNSLKKEKKSPLHTPPGSSHSTPKRSSRPSLDFLVTGKQILKRSDRANSLPGGYSRQPPSASHLRGRRISERPDESQASNDPLGDDLSLDLSQMSNFDEGKLPLATSTPNPSEVNYKPSSEVGSKPSSEVGSKPPSEVGFKPAFPRPGQKPRSASLQHIQQRVEKRTQQSVDLPSRRSQQSVDLSSRRSQQSVDSSSRGQESADVSSKPSRDSTFSCSRDSFKTPSSASNYRYGTDYSSVSPELSQSSPETSPRAEPSPVLSSFTQSWAERTVEGGGEWSRFWANYKHALPRAPFGYDQCPTPYRQDPNQTDFDWSAHSPESIQHISSVIQREGLRLTSRDTQHVIRCAHLLGTVLSRAIDRQRTGEPDMEDKKKNLTLDLKEPPVKQSETVMTQTDISLPNTKSAPLIFESILRQLSKNSIDEPDVKAEKDVTENK